MIVRFIDFQYYFILYIEQFQYYFILYIILLFLTTSLSHILSSLYYCCDLKFHFNECAVATSSSITADKSRCYMIINRSPQRLHPSIRGHRTCLQTDTGRVYPAM